MLYFISTKSNGIDSQGPLAAFRSKRDAMGFYADYFRKYYLRAGESSPAYLYRGWSQSDCADVPEWMLSFGPKGGVRCERP